MFFSGPGFGRDRTYEFNRSEAEKNRVVCALSYIPLLFWLPLVTGGGSYCRFHANQGFIALLCYIALNIGRGALDFLISLGNHVLGGLVGGVLAFILWLPIVALGVISISIMLFGILNAVQCAAREIPLVGRFKIIK
ncbi:hypothetical protein FACS1894120_0540 [Clostridia bacterium]|nr:hypothetical protein FACS1894120_0540 [Clostridia bacterium]